MENTLFFYPSAASEPWELSHSIKPDITLRCQTVLICFMDFMDRRCSMTNRSVRCSNSISPNWHLCWVWRDACCWNCWNAFEMDPMISLWDRPWDPPIVWDLGERARSRVWRREENHPLSFTVRSVISERASRSSDDLGFHLKRQPITYGFGYHTTDSRKWVKMCCSTYKDVFWVGNEGSFHSKLEDQCQFKYEHNAWRPQQFNSIQPVKTLRYHSSLGTYILKTYIFKRLFTIEFGLRFTKLYLNLNQQTGC